jgi:HK97 family phage portal protein
MSIFAPLTRAMAALRVRRADPQQRSGFGLFRGNAGPAVTHDNAQQVAAVWACMDVIASALSSSDWNVYAGVRGASNKSDLPDDNLQYILNTRFNSEMTAQAGKRAIALAAVGYGTGYAEIERDLSERIVALWPIKPDRVDPRRDAETGRLFYRINQEMGGGWVDLEPEKLFIVRGASLVGFAGDDPIVRAIQTISTALALDQYAGGFFGNGAQLGTVFTYKGKLDDAHYERVKKQIEQRHSGVKNAFRSGFFEGAGDWTVNQMGIDAEKSQLVNVKHLSIEEICRWFRVPPHKVAHLLRATNNNIEHQGLEFTRDTLRPWVKEIEQEVDYKLIPYRGPKKFVEIDTDWAEQGDYKSRAEAFSTLIGCGVFSPNVVLQKLGENTIGPEGDMRFVNGAAIPLDRIGDAYEAANAPAEQPEPEPQASAKPVEGAWLASIYARIQRRVENRAEHLQKAGRPDWLAEARSSTSTFALELMSDMADVLGDRFTTANKWALQVVNGCDPQVAAAAAMTAETTVTDIVAEANKEVTSNLAALSGKFERMAEALAAKSTTVHAHITNDVKAPDVHVAGTTVNVPEQNVSVTVPERAVNVNVERPVMNLEQPINVNVPESVVNVNVEAPKVEMPAPVVNVQAGDTHVTVPERSITVEPAPVHNEVNVGAPVVNVPQGAAPVVNVTAQASPAQVKIVNEVQPAAVEVAVQLPDRHTSSVIERDSKGNIVQMDHTTTTLPPEEGI